MEFDYIIVGAGSAGCVLAERLSRDGKSSVLVLEAGSRNQSPLIRMPRGMARIWANPRYFWPFPIEPQPFRPKNETWYYGKGLGGSSAVNGTWYYRGQPKDYDAWETQGNPGWNWREIERCYKEMEDYREPGAHASRGRDGLLQVTAMPQRSKMTEAVLEAGRQWGLPVLEDVNQPGTHGIGRTQMTVDPSGRRVSAYTAFLRRAEQRRNLELKPFVLVERVLFSGTRIVGVLCRASQGKVEFRARREVILCAGVLQSPKLLQLSGVGPGQVLRQHGIAVVHDNPAVGQNMAEHMMLSLSFRLNGVHGHNREFRGWRLWRNTFQYLALGTGLMASVLPEASAMLSTTGDPSWPDVQLGISPYSMATSQDEKPEAGRGAPELAPGVTVSGFYLRPRGRGSVTIRSGRIEDPPRVFANWLSDEADRSSALALFKTLRQFMRQPALSAFVGEEIVPGPKVETDEDILKAVEWMLSTGLHGTGTCRMGPARESVVDAQLRVHGVSGLRVVDCSVMPTPISGNTNGPAMALAWRASDLILAETGTERRSASATAAA